MCLLEEARHGKVAVTYDAAADHFDETPLDFWNRHGRGAVDRLQLLPGDRVLDVGCGTGASALPAAEAVGAAGHVIGIDIAENMLSRARAKAKARGLENIAFELADMADSGYADRSFDGIVAVFSVFFVPDMQHQLTELWRLLKPGGRLVVTVWSHNAFQPAAAIFADGFRRFRPDLATTDRPWTRLSNTDNLRDLLLASGTSEPVIDAVADSQPLTEPDDWWTIAMGSGFRWEIEQLQPADRSSLRTLVNEKLSLMNVYGIDTGAIHAVARK